MKIVVTGGRGGLGGEIMTALERRGMPGTSASRRSGVDLGTGAGLQAALDGADVVVHAASSPRHSRAVDLGGTRRIIEILERQPQAARLVYVSIVGCDLSPFRYYRAKYACEIAVRLSDLPATVVRATQFHTLVATIAKAATLGARVLAPQGMRFQSCDPRWVAEQLVDHALAAAPDGFGRVADLAGPEEISLTAAAELVAVHDGHLVPKPWRIPPVIGTLRSFARGDNLPGPDSQVGGSSFTDWLKARRTA